MSHVTARQRQMTNASRVPRRTLTLTAVNFKTSEKRLRVELVNGPHK